MLVYLFGPIDEAAPHTNSWRGSIRRLTPVNWVVFDPHRAFYLESKSADPDAKHRVSYINRRAIDQADVLIGTIEGPAFGTIREIEYARGFGKPVIIIGQERKGVEFHDLIQVQTIEQAVGAASEYAPRVHPGTVSEPIERRTGITEALAGAAGGFERFPLDDNLSPRNR